MTVSIARRAGTISLHCPAGAMQDRLKIADAG